MGRTLYDKLWDAHLVDERDDGSALIYIDRHLIHEVTSPQAFEGLRLQNRLPRRLNANVAVPDHNVFYRPKKGPWQATQALPTRPVDCSWRRSTKIAMTLRFRSLISLISVRESCTLWVQSRARLTWYDHCLW